MKILFFNQYGPGDSSPTAVLLQDLAEALSGQGWEVAWAVDRAAYGSRKAGWKRWLAEAGVHLRLFLQGLGSSRPEVVVSLTSPVCLVVTASLVAKWHGARHVHWAMDLYPDLALALGEIREGLLFRCLKTATGWAYRSCDQVVSLDEDMKEHLSSRYGISSVMIHPWPGQVGKTDWNRPPVVEGGRSWLYSGNLGRAHEWETLLEAQSLLEKEGVPVDLIFQGNGPETKQAQKRAEALGLRRCFFRGYAPRENFLPSLLDSSVLIATRKPATCGLLWPSKLALLQELPRPLLWVGDTQGHVATALKTRERTGVFSPGQSGKVKEWILAAIQEAPEPAGKRPDPDQLRSGGIKQWMGLLETKLIQAADLA